jgi:hypothetical protein
MKTGLLLLLLLVVGAGLGSSAHGATNTAVPSASTSAPASVRDSPGWYPTVDPESMSVVLGRRTHAPVVKTSLKGGVGSLKEMGRVVCRMLESGAPDSLHALCVTESEFRDIMWREFPQSRPATGLTWEDGWRVLDVRLLSGTRDATADFGRRKYEFVRFERTQASQDTTAVYKNFKLHNRLVLVARRGDGELERMYWLRSVVERKGRFKIYSTTD